MNMNKSKDRNGTEKLGNDWKGEKERERERDKGIKGERKIKIR